RFESELTLPGFDYSAAGDEREFEITVNNSTHTITLNDNYTDLNGVISEINNQLSAAGAGVTAQLGTGDTLIIQSNTPGADSSFAVTSSDIDFGANSSIDLGQTADVLHRTAVVYDSLGTTHRINTAYTKIGDNRWG